MAIDSSTYNISWTDLTLRSTTTVPLTNPQMDNNFLESLENIDTLSEWLDDVTYEVNRLDRNLIYGQGGISSTFFTGDQFKALRDDFNALNTSLGLLNKLGYTPVQQGGGVGQGASKVIIGWSNATSGTSQNKLLLQVDSTNFAENWPIKAALAGQSDNANYANAAGTVPFSGVTGLAVTDNAQGHRFISTSEPTASDGANGDIWYQY
jgi:hypothetical protein